MIAKALLVVLAFTFTNRIGNTESLLAPASTGTTGFPFNGIATGSPGTRFQQAYPSTRFAGLTGPVKITSIDFFPGLNSTLRTGTYSLYLSTIQTAVDKLSQTNFDANVGADNALFATMNLTGLAPGVLTFGGNPFVYDPSAGNLLVDIRIANGGTDGTGVTSAAPAVGVYAYHNFYGNGIGSLYALATRFNLSTPTTPISPIGVSPETAAGATQPMTFAFNHPQGYQRLDILNILVNNALDGRNACYLAYSQPGNVLYLVGDDGGALLPGAALSAAGALENSQCVVSWTGSPVTASGNTLQLALTIAGKTRFAGNRIVYLAARDQAGGNSNWQAMGVWQVPGGTSSMTTRVLSMTPARGSGTAAWPITFVVNDTASAGSQDLGVINVLINRFLDGRYGCYLAYSQPTNVLYLVNDTGDALLPGKTLSVFGSMANSQCTVTWDSGAVRLIGHNLNLTLSIAPKTAFIGNQTVFVAARDAAEANNSGWQAIGTWGVQ